MENLQETIDFPMKCGISLFFLFPLNQPIETALTHAQLAPGKVGELMRKGVAGKWSPMDPWGQKLCGNEGRTANNKKQSTENT